MAGEINFGILNTNAPMQVAQAFDAGRDEKRKSRLAEMAMQQQEQQMADETATRDAHIKYGDDKSAIIRALNAGGQYKQAEAVQSKISAQQKEALAMQKTKLENGLKTYEAMGQLMSGVKDQASYDAARQQLAQFVGPDVVSKIPAMYDPAYVEQGRMQAMTVKDQLANQWKSIDAQLNRDKFDYQQKNDARVDDRIRSEGALNRGVQIRGQNLTDARAKDALASKQTPQGKPLPTSALKMQQEELDAIGTASSINADMSAVEKQINSGKLDLGLVSNATGAARNYLGLSNESSKNLASFKATLEKLRNDSLRLNKGVQTDGDAQRAWNELLTNINDPGVVKQRLDEIKKINERAVSIRKMNVDNIRRNYGATDLDTSGYENQKAAIGGGGGSNIDDLLKKYGG